MPVTTSVGGVNDAEHGSRGGLPRCDICRGQGVHNGLDAGNARAAVVALRIGLLREPVTRAGRRGCRRPNLVINSVVCTRQGTEATADC